MFVSATDSTSHPLSDITSSPETTTPGGSTYEPLNTSVNQPVNYEQLPTTTSTQTPGGSTYEPLNTSADQPANYEQLPTRPAAVPQSTGHEHEHDYYNIKDSSNVNLR